MPHFWSLELPPTVMMCQLGSKLCTFACVRMCVRVCVCMCVHVRACVCMCVHVCACVCMCVHVCALYCALCMCLCVCACGTSCALLCLPHPAPPPSLIVCAPPLASIHVVQRPVSPSRGCSPRAHSPRGVGGPRQPPSPPSPSPTWSSRRPGCTSPPGRTRSWRRCVLRVACHLC